MCAVLSCHLYRTRTATGCSTAAQSHLNIDVKLLPIISQELTQTTTASNKSFVMAMYKEEFIYRVQMNVRPLSTALRSKANKEINEDLERVPLDLKMLRDSLKEIPHLSSVQPTDQWLIAFLRGNKYNLEKAKEKLVKYYALKTAVPDLYANRDPFDPKIQDLLKLGVFLPLRQCASEDSPRTCLVMVTQLSKTEYSLLDLIKVAFMIIEIVMLEDDNFTIAGEDIISDLKDVSFALLAQFTPVLARKVFTCIGVLTVRMKGIHIINAPRGITMAVAVLKMFLSAKLKNRIYAFKDNYDSLYERFPETILPAEFGGNDGNIQELADYWKTKVESYRNWFLQCAETPEADTATSELNANKSDL